MLFYAGPDQILPIATFLSTVAGVAMIFWGKILRVASKIWGLFSPKDHAEGKPEA